MALFNPFKSSRPAAAPQASAGPAAPAGPSVNDIAGGMCDRKGVHWAVESATLAGPSGDPHDAAALEAARGWMKSPSAQTKSAAAAAALKAGHGGPGAWAAQAAAWAGGSPGGAGLPGKPAGGPSLTGRAVAGSVALSAAKMAGVRLPAAGMKTPVASTGLPSVPAMPSDADKAKMAEMHKPFVELGQKIAADPSVKC